MSNVMVQDRELTEALNLELRPSNPKWIKVDGEHMIHPDRSLVFRTPVCYIADETGRVTTPFPLSESISEVISDLKGSHLLDGGFEVCRRLEAHRAEQMSRVVHFQVAPGIIEGQMLENYVHGQEVGPTLMEFKEYPVVQIVISYPYESAGPLDESLGAFAGNGKAYWGHIHHIDSKNRHVKIQLWGGTYRTLMFDRIRSITAPSNDYIVGVRMRDVIYESDERGRAWRLFAEPIDPTNELAASSKPFLESRINRLLERGRALNSLATEALSQRKALGEDRTQKVVDFLKSLA